MAEDAGCYFADDSGASRGYTGQSGGAYGEGRGLRVKRFYGKPIKSVRQEAPWAKRIVKVGSVYVAYESEADSMHEHCTLNGLRAAKAPPSNDFHRYVVWL